MRKRYFFGGLLTALIIISLSLNIFFVRRELSQSKAIPQTDAKISALLALDLDDEDEDDFAASDKDGPNKGNLTVRKINYEKYYYRGIVIRFDKHHAVQQAKPSSIILQPGVEDLKISFEDDYWCLQGSFEPERVYQLTLKAGIHASDGRKISEDLLYNVKIPGLEPQARFLTKGPYYPALQADGQKKSLILPIGYTKVEKLSFNLYKTYDNNIAWQEEFYFWKTYQKKIKSLEVALPPSGNQEQVLEFNLEDILAEQKTGIYTLYIQGSPYISEKIDLVLSDISIVAALDPVGGSCQVMLRSLADAGALADAQVKIYSQKKQLVAQGSSDAQGKALLKFLPEFDGDNDAPEIILAKKQDDVTYINLDYSRKHDLSVFSNEGRKMSLQAEAFIYSERGVYQPGEEIAISLFAREANGTGGKALATPLKLFVADPLGRVFSTVNLESDAHGFASCKLKLPGNARSGNYQIRAGLEQERPWGEYSVLVATYVPDRIKVKLDCSKMPDSDCLVSADYYFGEPLKNGLANFTAVASEAKAPLHWQGFQVGDSSVFKAGKVFERNNLAFSSPMALQYPGFVQCGGHSSAPVQINLSVSAREIGGRAVSGTGSFIYHPSPYYLGVKYEEADNLDRRKTRLRLRQLSWDPELKLSPKNLNLRLKLQRLEWKYVRKVNEKGKVSYDWQCLKIECKAPERLRMRELEMLLELDELADGSYELLLEGPAGIRSKLAFWHYQGQGGARSSNPDILNFSTDKQLYQKGEEAGVFLDALEEGLLLVMPGGEEGLAPGFEQKIKPGKNLFQVPIPEHVRGKYYFAAVTLLQGGAAGKRSFGLLRLPIEQNQHRLQIEIQAPYKAYSGEKLALSLKLKDMANQPCSGKVQVFAVDEGILALTNFKTPDIFGFFHGDNYCRFSYHDIYSALFPDLQGEKSSSIGGDLAFSSRISELKVAEAALWLGPALEVPKDGISGIEMQLPQHHGALRLMAVAVADDKLGSFEQQIILKEPISVQITAPLALAPGDKFILSLNAFNHEVPQKQAELLLQLPEGLIVEGAKTFSLDLPQGTSQNLQVPCLVAETATGGDISCQIKLGDFSRSSSVPLTVRPATLPITRFKNIELAPGKSHNLAFEAAQWQGVPQTSLRISASPALAVSEALQWLDAYPYNCLEQTVARLLPYLASAELLHSGLLSADMQAGIAAKEESGQAAILAMMQSDGSFALWQDSQSSHPEASLFAIYYLIAAENYRGQKLHGSIKRRLLDYAELVLEGYRSSSWQKAYACYILATAKSSAFLQPARRILKKEQKSLSAFLAAAALIQGGYAAEGAARLEKMPLAELWQEEYNADPGFLMQSETSRMALILSVLLQNIPSHAGAAPLALQLQSRLRNDGSAWGHTHVNAWGAYALALFANRSKPGKAIGKIQLPEDRELSIDSDKSELFKLGRQAGSVTVQNQGEATFYVQQQLFGSPDSMESKASGLELERQYLTLAGKPADKISQGQLLTVKISLKSKVDIDSLVLVDLLPGGLELEDSHLATRTYIPAVEKNQDKDKPLKIELIEGRGDRFLLFGQLSKNEPATVEYKVRAVSRGSYALPASTAESMYNPEIHCISQPQGKLEVH